MYYGIVYFVFVIFITYKMAKVSRFINDIKQVKEISYAVVKDNEHLKIHRLENLMLCQSSSL